MKISDFHFPPFRISDYQPANLTYHLIHASVEACTVTEPFEKRVHVLLHLRYRSKVVIQSLCVAGAAFRSY